jgi:predicted aspartyl protease
MTDVFSFEYDAEYPGPAFPILTLGISGMPSGKSQTLTALIDSGADATLIPLKTLQAVKARKMDTRWARNISGVRYRVAMYIVTLSIGTLTFPDIDVIANQQTDEIVIGRDILNQLIVTLNGPIQRVVITQ